MYFLIALLLNGVMATWATRIAMKKGHCGYVWWSAAFGLPILGLVLASGLSDKSSVIREQE